MTETLNNEQNSKFKIEFSKFISIFKNPHSLFYYFLILLGTGILFFITSLAINSFTTPFTGDYVTQQYAFYNNVYDGWWHFFKTGSFQYFDFNTYLGVNNLGSNSFYSLTDPFFFLCLFVPRDFLPQAMAISSIIRMSLNGLIFYFYLRYMGISMKSSKLAGLAFAYCGWTAWYLWFNCYTENGFVFILILFGIEKVLREKKPWLLMGSLFLSGLTNYFFLVAFAIIGFIYAMYRYFQRLKLNDVRDNLFILLYGFLGFLFGIMMGFVVLLPSLVVASQAPRASSDGYLENLLASLKNFDIKAFFDYIFLWKKADNGLEWRHYFPIIEFFYPVMSDRGTPLMNYSNGTYDNVAGSLFLFFPFIIFYLPALIRSTKKHNFWPLAASLLFIIMLMTPFSYYLFFGFTKPYSRWYIFVISSLLTYVAEYMDHLDEEPKWSVLVGGIFTLFGVIASGLIASYIIKNVYAYQERYPLATVMAIEIAYVMVLSLVIFFLRNKKYFKTVLLGVIVVEASIMGALTIDGHGYTSFNDVNYGITLNHELSKVVNRVNSDDKTYFRSASSLIGDANKNDGASNGYNGVSYFHSLYNFNVKKFTYWNMFMASESGWSGKYTEKRAGLDKFLGLKYYYLEKDKNMVLMEGSNYIEVTPNLPMYFTDVTDEYENKYFNIYKDTENLDFAISVDNVVAYEDASGKDLLSSAIGSYPSYSPWLAIRNEELYLSSAILSKDDANAINDKYLEISKKMVTAPFSFDSSYSYTPISNKLYYPMPKSAKNMGIKEILNVINTSAPEIIAPLSSLNNYAVVIDGSSLPYDSGGMIYYFDIPYLNSEKVNIYLIDDDDKVITWDNHNDNRCTDNTTRRGPRAFYVNPDSSTGVAPKVNKILLIHRYNLEAQFHGVGYISLSSFRNIIGNLKDTAPKNIHFRDDHFDFTTDYALARFVVTQVAYDSGWKIKAKKDGKITDVKTYLTQGGFVGFVAEPGHVYYSMDYETPMLQEGKLLSVLGMSVFFTSLISYLYIETKKKEKMELNWLQK